MVEHLGFSFMFKVFGILYRIAAAITSTLFMIVLSRSILQFSGIKNIGVLYIILKQKQHESSDNIRSIPPDDLKSLRFGAESIWDDRFVICHVISKSDHKSLRLARNQ